MKKLALVITVLAFLIWLPSIQQAQELIPNVDLKAVSLDIGGTYGDSIELVIEIDVSILDSMVVTTDTGTGEIDTIFTYPHDSTIEVPEIVRVDQEEKHRHNIQILGFTGALNVCEVETDPNYGTYLCREKAGKNCPDRNIKKCGTLHTQKALGCKWIVAPGGNINKIMCRCLYPASPVQKPKIPKPSPAGNDEYLIELIVDPDNVMPEYDESNNAISITYIPGNIPTLTEWGLIIFGVLLAGWMAWVIARRRRLASRRA